MTAPILPASSSPPPDRPVPAAATESQQRFSDVLSGKSREHAPVARAGGDATDTQKHGSAGKGQLKTAIRLNNAQDEISTALEDTLPGIALAIASQAAQLRAEADHSDAGSARPSTANARLAASEARPAIALDGAAPSRLELAGLNPAADDSITLRQAVSTGALPPALPRSAPTAADRGLPIDAGQPAARAGRNSTAAAAESIKTMSPAQANRAGERPDGLPAFAYAPDNSLPGAAAAQPAQEGFAVLSHAPGQSLSGQASPSLAAPAANGQAIGVPLQHSQWSQAFGQQFLNLAQSAKNHSSPQIAELRLDPPELGPIRISLQVTDNIAHAVFISAHPLVRQTLEQALPQLQEQLAQAGISLGQASVSDQESSAAAFEQMAGHRQATSGKTPASHSGDTALPAATRSPLPDALVDTFA